MAVTLKDVERVAQIRHVARSLSSPTHEDAPLFARLLDKGVCDNDSRDKCTSRKDVLSTEAYFLLSLADSSYNPTSSQPLATQYSNAKHLADRLLTIVTPFCSAKNTDGEKSGSVKTDRGCFAVSVAILLDTLGSETNVEAALKEGSPFVDGALDMLEIYYNLGGTERKFTDAIQ